MVQCQYCGASNTVGSGSSAGKGPRRVTAADSANGIWIAGGLLVLLVAGGTVAGVAMKGGTVFGEWFGAACLVDANGDDVLDVVGRSGKVGGETQSLTIVDGGDGEVLWKGPADVGHEHEVLCLGDDAFGVASVDPHLTVFDPKTRETRWSMPLPDRLYAYGVEEDCLHLQTADQEEPTVGLTDGKARACSSAVEPVNLAPPGYFGDQSSVELEGDGTTYRVSVKQKGTPLLTVSAHRGDEQLWETRLRYAQAADAVFFARTPETLLTYGVDPAKSDSGVLIGIDAKTGRVRYEAPQGSRWSTHFPRAFTFNGRHLVMTWGFGLHAYDPTTGERVWNIGGR